MSKGNHEEYNAFRKAKCLEKLASQSGCDITNGCIHIINSAKYLIGEGQNRLYRHRVSNNHDLPGIALVGVCVQDLADGFSDAGGSLHPVVELASHPQFLSSDNAREYWRAIFAPFIGRLYSQK